MVKDINTDNFADVFRDVQQESGLLIREVADTAGLHIATVSAWRQKGIYPNFESLCYALDAMGYKLQVTEKWER